MDVVKKSVDFFLISSFRLGLTGTCALKFLKNFHVTKTETLFFIFFFFYFYFYFFFLIGQSKRISVAEAFRIIDFNSVIQLLSSNWQIHREHYRNW